MGRLAVRCEFVAGSSSKFWECAQEGLRVVTSHGKLGGTITNIPKDFASEEKAKQAFHSQLNSKLKKGYVEKGKPKHICKGFGKPAPMASIMKVAMKVAMKVKATAMKAAKPGGGSKVLLGKTLCFTGALAIKRSVATSLAKKHGAKVTGSVSKSTDILVVGKDAGSKIVKGSSSMQYWDEKKFLKVVGMK